MKENITYKYNLPIRILHALMAFMLIGMIISGYFMAKLDPETDSYKWDLYKLHKSFGICFLFLSIVRIIVRIKSYSPPYRHEFSKLVRFLSAFVQKGFYMFFFLIPLTGYFGSALSGYDVFLFGYKIPNILNVNKNLGGTMHYLHSILPYLSLAFIFLHVSGVVKHRYFDKKDILERIW